ncbi:hypothetical protein MD484_g7454, partial [Candolleomyces efflorescens]
MLTLSAGPLENTYVRSFGEGVCTIVNEWYSQCIPGTANPPSSTNPTSTVTSNPPSNTGAAPSLPTSFRWSSSGPLISPKNDSRNLAGVKDPSVVYHNGRWHVFATTAKSGGWNLFYTNFTEWSQAASAPFFYLDQSGIGTGYRAAPQIFYFAPQKLWYLVYQNNNAAYSTNPDISNPRAWTAPKTFYSGTPRIITQNIGDGYWVDMWVICDASLCHLFSSDDNGHLYRSQTTIANFPNGFNEPVIALQDTKNRLFEASNVYRLLHVQLLQIYSIFEHEQVLSFWYASALTKRSFPAGPADPLLHHYKTIDEAEYLLDQLPPPSIDDDELVKKLRARLKDLLENLRNGAEGTIKG